MTTCNHAWEELPDGGQNCFECGRTRARAPGRPRSNPEGAQRINVILFPDELARLEEWADSVEQYTGRRPGRSELIRRVIECSGDAPIDTLLGRRNG